MCPSGGAIVVSFPSQFLYEQARPDLLLGFFFPLWLYCFFASSPAIRTCDFFFYGVRHEQRASVTCVAAVAPLCNIGYIQIWFVRPLYDALNHYLSDAQYALSREREIQGIIHVFLKKTQAFERKLYAPQKNKMR